MNFADVKLAVSNLLKRDDMSGDVPQFVSFGQKTLERVLRPRAMEYVAPSFVLTQYTNQIAVPADYKEMLYISLLDPDNYTRYRVVDRYFSKKYVDLLPLGYMVNSHVYTSNTAAAGGMLAVQSPVPAIGDIGVVNTSGVITTYFLKSATYTSLANWQLISNAVGLPCVYTRKADTLYLDLFADKGYFVEMCYYQKFADITLSVGGATPDINTNYWSLNAEQLLIYASLVEAIPFLGDDPRALVWQAKYELELAKFISEDNRERMSGGHERYLPMNVFLNRTGEVGIPATTRS